jgi:Cys-tRNA(Pro)/Cys-tRNA(Cys) deacylase
MNGYVTEVAGRGTMATIALERAKIGFTLHEYPHDPRAGSYGLEASEALGVPPERVFKTLVAAVDGGALAVGVIPVHRQLDLKALAAAVGGKKAVMAEVAAAERATGYVAGGISPVGQRKRLPVVIDASALELGTLFCSAGRRGLEIEITPADLIKAAGAKVAAIAAGLAAGNQENHSSERTVATAASSTWASSEAGRSAASTVVAASGSASSGSASAGSASS